MRSLFFSILLIATVTILFSSCSEDDGISADNWAGAVEGTYIGTIDYGGGEAATVLMTRIADKQLNIKVDFDYFTGGGGSIHYTYCLDSVSMTSATTFTINEYDGCDISHASGGGNFSGNTVSFTVHGYAVNATKQ